MICALIGTLEPKDPEASASGPAKPGPTPSSEQKKGNKRKAEGQPAVIVNGSAPKSPAATTAVFQNSHDRVAAGSAASATPGGAKTLPAQRAGSAGTTPVAKTPMEKKQAKENVGSGLPEASGTKKAKVLADPSPLQGRKGQEAAATVASSSNGSTPEVRGGTKPLLMPKSVLKTPKPAAAGAAAFPVSSLKAEAAAGGSKPTPGQGAGSDSQRKPGGAATPGMTPGKTLESPKKRVKIDLKQNLFHAVGGPIPHPDLRTPSRVKGGILKVREDAVVAAAPSSAPAKVGGSKMATGRGAGQQQQRQPQAGSASVGKQPKPFMPGSAGQATPRAKAALFF